MGFARNTLGQLTGIYVPSPVEVFLALGILAFGLLLITVSMKVLPMETPDDEDDDDLAPFRGSAANDAALEAEVTPL
jgi:Ni/Fe-hydrogenase subunit HybB-like protein